MGPGRKFIIVLMAAVLMLALLPWPEEAAAQSDVVFYIPVKGEINPAMASLCRQLDRATRKVHPSLCGDNQLEGG